MGCWRIKGAESSKLKSERGSMTLDNTVVEKSFGS